MKTSRILFVAPSAYTLSGLATWLDYLVPALRALGWDVVLGLVQGARFHDPRAYLATHPEARLVFIPCSTGTPEGRRRALKKVLQRIRPDLVVSVNIPDVYSTVQELRAAGRFAPRCVMANHGLMSELVTDAACYAPVLDAVVSANRLGCALLERAGISAERVHYAPCGVACEPVLRERVSRVTEPFRILYCGRFDQQQKRVLDIPGILHETSRWIGAVICEFVGDGPEKETLRQQLAPVAPGVRADFAGYLSPPEMHQAYLRADALLVTSAWETGPLVVWEAMAAGLPVVSSRYLGSGLESALVDGVNCLQFDVADIQGAAGALAQLATGPELADRLRRAAHAMVSARYSRPASVEMWDRALRQALAAPALPPPPALPAVHATGRLDRWLGPSQAENIRSLLGLRMSHRNAGGEWPYTHSGLAPEQAEEFSKVAEKLDRPVAGQTSKD